MKVYYIEFPIRIRGFPNKIRYFLVFDAHMFSQNGHGLVTKPKAQGAAGPQNAVVG